MKSEFGSRLYLLQDEELVRDVIWGDFDPPAELDDATKKIL